MNYTFNYMIDGDLGTSKGSPYYRGAMKVPAIITCPNCKGFKQFAECCEKAGEICQHEVVCPMIDCSECDGTGQVEEKE